MADIATDLKQHFNWAMDLSLESYEVLPDARSFVRSDEDERAVEIFKNLRDSVDQIPPSFLMAAEELRAASPELFEKSLAHGVQAVGASLFPADATEFVESLIQTATQQITPSQSETRRPPGP